MTHLIIDGDDIGRQITAFYIRNDATALSGFISCLQSKLKLITDFLESAGFSIIFSAADGVAAHCDASLLNDNEVYQSIEAIAGDTGLTFSVGVGTNLREAYVALLSAKSNGKAHLRNYRDID